MKSLYKKSELLFSLIWIAAYCAFMSLGDILSEKVGTEKAVTLPIALLLSAVLFIFIKRSGLSSKYGLCKAQVSAKNMLYYLPVLLMLTVNLWGGVRLNLSVTETALYILSMLFVGFLEEVIFRGLLFNAMKKDNLKSAIIVSAITFGTGHTVNLINGSGASVFENILQILYASAAGFMFVMIFYKSKSLILCILAHGVFNALSVFADETAKTEKSSIISALFITVLCGGYGLYLYKLKSEKENID